MQESERRRIISLIVKKIEGNLNKKENIELEHWAMLSADNRQLLNELMNKHKLTQALLEYGNLDGTPIWNRMTAEMPALLSVSKEKHPRISVLRRWLDHIQSLVLQPRLAVAFCLLIITAIALPFLWHNYIRQKAGQERNIIPMAKKDPQKDLLPPSGQKVQIVLPNDSTVDVATLPKGESRQYGNLEVTRTGEETVTCTIRADADGKLSDDYKFITPRGKGIKVKLPDSSTVRLNAASSLSIANSFRQNRRVTLQGEGYFEVAPPITGGIDQKRAFVVDVKSAHDTVNILAFGTRFNVMAYEEDGFIRTTLLKGTVRVRERAHSVSLHPGEQYVQYLDGKDSLVPSADTTEALAWKNDWFIFRGQPLPQVMNQLCRWYDAYVTYVDTPNVSIITQGSRKAPVSVVLKRIEAFGGVHFDIEDRRITVSSR